MLNHVDIMGRLVRDPELKTTPSGVSVCTVTIACDRDYADKATGDRECDFIDVTAWRAGAEFLAKYFGKGRMAVVSGRLQTRKYTDNNGNDRVKTEIVADNVYFGDSKKDSVPSTTGAAQYAPISGDDEDVPF